MRSLLFFLLSLILVVMCSCQYQTSHNITQEDVEKVINEKIPTGTSKSDVTAFLNRLKMGSRPVEGIRDRSGPSDSSWDEDIQPPNVHSYVNAVILKAGTDRDGLFTRSYYFSMHFYFDENEKLIGHFLYTFFHT
jgi:hypothetical protein